MVFVSASLHHPEDRGVHIGGQGPLLPAPAQRRLQAAPARLAEQSRYVTHPRDRGRRLLALRRAQRGQRPPELGDGGPAALGDHLEGLLGPSRVAAGHHRPGLRLDHHDRDGVRHDVVHLAGDPVAVARGGCGSFLLLAGGAFPATAIRSPRPREAIPMLYAATYAIPTYPKVAAFSPGTTSETTTPTACTPIATCRQGTASATRTCTSRRAARTAAAASGARARGR
ncbi:hypothetical protein V2I01_12095 [Micromonospora sp. BRA006-A]|nr:hypothetical protein [Micromonospora sp. BRA006-A]